MVPQDPPNFYIDWFVIINRAFQYVRFIKYNRISKMQLEEASFYCWFWSFIVLNEGDCVLDPERIIMFCEIVVNSAAVIGGRFHSRGQCFNFRFLSVSWFCFQFLKALKRGFVLSLLNQMVTITLVLFYGFVNWRRNES